MKQYLAILLGCSVTFRFKLKYQGNNQFNKKTLNTFFVIIIKITYILFAIKLHLNLVSVILVNSQFELYLVLIFPQHYKTSSNSKFNQSAFIYSCHLVSHHRPKVLAPIDSPYLYRRHNWVLIQFLVKTLEMHKYLFRVEWHFLALQPVKIISLHQNPKWL